MARGRESPARPGAEWSSSGEPRDCFHPPDMVQKNGCGERKWLGMVMLIWPIMTVDDGDERILETTMLNGDDAADDGFEGDGGAGGRGIDV